MVFSSPVFLFVFLPAVFLLYQFMPGIKSKNVLLMLFSLLFYGFGEPVYVFLLLASVVVNYAGGMLLASPCRRRRLVLAAVVVCNLGLLSVFKYTDFILESLNMALPVSLPLTGIVLPIGISFFTFQGLSYVMDVYREPEVVSRSFAKLVLYISFFPQLIAGPIVKYHDVSEQIDCRQVTLPLVADGLRRFLLGLSKKLLLANTVGQMADMAFTAEASRLDMRVAWLGALCYMLQIYFDFSGYSDMAIGLGRMFGFQFLENFNYPFISGSIKEFWRRWHISLSSWFRDYLYIPLGGNRKGKLRTGLNKCIVFFCTGLWHGASWNFVLWGLWHGFFIILEDLLPRRGKAVKVLGYVTTPLVVLLGFVLFRAETLESAGLMFSQMFAGVEMTVQSSALLSAMLTPLSVTTLAAAVLCSFPLLGKAKVLAASGGPVLEKTLHALSYGAAGLLFVLCVMNLAGSEFNPFIYFRF